MNNDHYHFGHGYFSNHINMVYTNVFWRTYRFCRSITVIFEFEMFSTEGSLAEAHMIESGGGSISGSSRDLTPPNASDYAENQENVIVLLRRQKRWKTCLGMSHVE
ncbi:hypothetical protein HID58_007273 [Brassica napus]|uniref:Uncharacterized protein n=1 Tax=Brassica napus TaxID=3708 RepID=A0ABQ7X8S9_BRANA|nr:hypothetical protein HID58_090848 [Brassica napus]KAH0939812.1 hypothetical protein HID58_007273 [Brassica napus]